MSGPIRDFTPTMSSMQMVDYINEERKAKESVGGKRFIKLDHSDLMKKSPKVLGEGVGKFSGTYIHEQNGQTYDCYYFPEREACLIAMSYSYELQAKVFDHMRALENEFNADRLTTARERIPIHMATPIIYARTGMFYPQLYVAISKAAQADDFSKMKVSGLARVLPPLIRIGNAVDTQDDWRLLHANGVRLRDQPAQLPLGFDEQPDDG